MVAEAVKFGEPVLLVGETGTGKTSVCQQLATSLQLPLRIVNCHLNTDAADILGGYRPARSTETSALFEWHDGPLVESMRQGGLFLMDEISLADDSVLERLNSVLEPAKTLVLAEKGGSDLSDLLVRGQNTFHVLATMNPGGDFGKKELSPALRNRFTEIWVPSIDNDDDLHEILVTNVSPAQARASFDIARNILTYSHWFAPRFLDSTHITLRGLLAWSEFIRSSSLSPAQAFVHGALMTLVDGLGSLPALATSRPAEIDTLRYECVDELKKLAGLSEIDSATSFTDSPDALQIGPFSMSKPTPPPSGSESDFNLHAPTPRENCLRLLRALQIPKSVLLEGSPGVGKTSLVSALARSIGHPFIRINLSDQTDLSDLFGSDMPVDGGAPGQFAWRDAPFLTALQNGSWVLLDEMNLAPQPVLEGLNSCLDHRGEVFIPELGRTFPKHPSFRIFAAQNPTHQGGSRKGLPRSFVDRFTQVFVAPLTEEDLVMICKSADSSSDSQHVESIVRYSMQVLAVMGDPSSTFGSAGAPWDFNLRDILRWQRLLQRPSAPERLRSHPIEYLDMLVLQRFRTFEDRRYAQRLAETLISSNASEPVYTHVAVSPSVLIAGHSKLPRLCSPYLHQHLLGRNFTPAETTFHRAIESVSKAVEAKWMVILTGDAGVGKSSLLRSLALSTGNALEEFGVSHQTDALELLGSYEQADWVKAFGEVLDRVESLCLQSNDILPLPASPYLTRAIINAAQKLRFQLNSIPSSSTERQALVSSLRDLLKQLPASKAALEESAALLDDFETRGAFQWQDGPLIRALVEGRWFVIDNANLCPGSVLDRLNSLVETDGHLLLNEHTSQSEPARILRPHENFRIFLTYNPKHGEVSRAMRNRGIEVHLDQHKASAAPALFHPSASCLHLDESSSDALDHTSSYPNSDELPQAMVEQTPIALSATARLPNVSDIQLRPIVHQSDDLVKIALRQACFPETLSSILVRSQDLSSPFLFADSISSLLILFFLTYPPLALKSASGLHFPSSAAESPVPLNWQTFLSTRDSLYTMT